MTVIDASLLVDVLVGLPAGRRWRRWVAVAEDLAAPECVGVELGRYLRRHAVAGRLSVVDADRGLRAFTALGVQIYQTAPLLRDAFALRDDLTFDDALYVSLAGRLDQPLATTDERLARAAAGLGITVASPG